MKGLTLYVFEIDKFQSLVSNVCIFEWKLACLDGFCCIDNMRNVNVYSLRVSQKRHMPFFYHVTRENIERYSKEGRKIYTHICRSKANIYVFFSFIYFPSSKRNEVICHARLHQIDR